MIIVNELHALGLLSRTPDARDRRRKTGELTASGHDAVRKAQDIIGRPPFPIWSSSGKSSNSSAARNRPRRLRGGRREADYPAPPFS
jgi:DNA-binding MarR family transcriptional regulator